jgi:hypothetical protein
MKKSLLRILAHILSVVGQILSVVGKGLTLVGDFVRTQATKLHVANQ